MTEPLTYCSEWVKQVAAELSYTKSWPAPDKVEAVGELRNVYDAIEVLLTKIRNLEADLEGSCSSTIDEEVVAALIAGRQKCPARHDDDELEKPSAGPETS